MIITTRELMEFLQCPKSWVLGIRDKPRERKDLKQIFSSKKFREGKNLTSIDIARIVSPQTELTVEELLGITVALRKFAGKIILQPDQLRTNIDGIELLSSSDAITREKELTSIWVQSFQPILDGKSILPIAEAFLARKMLRAPFQKKLQVILYNLNPQSVTITRRIVEPPEEFEGLRTVISSIRLLQQEPKIPIAGVRCKGCNGC